MKIRPILLRSSSWLIACLAIAPSNSFAAQGAELSNSSPSDEILVTARKRSETALDVPIAISTISAADRKLQVLDGMKDYLRQIPGAALVASGPEYLQDVSIRGQGSGRLGISETATGIFRNGLYNAGGGFGGRSISRMDTFDAERVDVLRGPQGALYGRNSVGGAIDVSSAKPRFETEASIVLRASEEKRRAVEAVLNLPIASEKLAVRLGGFYDDQNGGHIRRAGGGAALDSQRFAGGRAAVRFLPSENTTIDLLYEYSDSVMPAFGILGRRATRTDGTALDVSSDIRNDMDRVGGAFIKEHLSMLLIEKEFDAFSLNLRALYKKRDAGRSGEDNDHFAGISSIDVIPGAEFGGPDISVAQSENHERGVVQAYLASKNASALKWTIGGEYLVSQTRSITDPNFCSTYSGLAQPKTSGCFVGVVGTLTGVSLSARNSGRLTLNNDNFREKLRSPSLFASAELDVSSRTKLGLEVRYQSDRKEIDFTRFSEDPLTYFGSATLPTGLAAPIAIDPDGSGPLPAVAVQFCPPNLTAAECAAGREALKVKGKSRKSFITPAVTIHHRFSRAANAYARFSTGYRPGGFNTGLPPTTTRDQVASQLNYDAEFAYSGEVGLKGAGSGFSYNVSAFYMKTRDVQIVSAPSALSRGFILQNAGSAHVYGLEAELRKLFKFENGTSLQFSLAASSQGGAFEQGASALLDPDGDGIPNSISLAGNEVPRLRDIQLTANAFASHKLGADSRIFFNGSVQYARGGFETPDNTRNFSDYTLVDARVGIEKGAVTVSLFGKNLTNKRYILNVLSLNQYYNDPRILGVELRGSF